MSAIHQVLLGTGATIPSLSYRTSAQQTGSATTFTFTTQDIGSASSARYVVVSTGAPNGGSAPSSVTVGGLSASLLKSQSVSSYNTSIWIAAVPTGATATVVVSTASSLSMGIGVWAVYNIMSSTAVATSGATGSAPSLNLTVSANGIVITSGFASDTSPTTTWTGVTENFDTVFDTNRMTTGASIVSVAGGSPLSVSAAYTGSAAGYVSAAVSLR